MSNTIIQEIAKIKAAAGPNNYAYFSANLSKYLWGEFFFNLRKAAILFDDLHFGTSPEIEKQYEECKNRIYDFSRETYDNAILFLAKDLRHEKSDAFYYQKEVEKAEIELEYIEFKIKHGLCCKCSRQCSEKGFQAVIDENKVKAEKAMEEVKIYKLSIELMELWFIEKGWSS